MSMLLRILMNQEDSEEVLNLATVKESNTSFDSLDMIRRYTPTDLRVSPLQADEIYNISFDYSIQVDETSGTEVSNTYIYGDKKFILNIENRPINFIRLITDIPKTQSGHVNNIFKVRKDITDIDSFIIIDNEKAKGIVSITNLIITKKI